ncbi:MAG: hypothetical protein ACXVB9_08435 [Bdellovibrionota bacterium]
MDSFSQNCAACEPNCLIHFLLLDIPQLPEIVRDFLP